MAPPSIPANFPLPPELLTAIILQGQLTLDDIAACRLVCSGWFRAFSTPQCCGFLLHHFFPFSTEVARHLKSSSIIHTPQVHAKVTKGVGKATALVIRDAEYDDFNKLCRKLYRAETQQWSTIFTREFPLPLPDAEVDELEHYHVVDVDAGYLLVTQVSESTTVHITVRNLLTGRNVHIPAPIAGFGAQPLRRETGSPVLADRGSRWRKGSVAKTVSIMREGKQEKPGVYMNRGMVLLVYSRDKDSGSMLVLVDGVKEGRAIWSAALNTPVFRGIPESTDEDAPKRNPSRKRLEPVFNDYYIAFLNTFSTTPTAPAGDLIICRYSSTASTAVFAESSQPSVHLCPLRIRAQTLISFKADKNGAHLLVAERFEPHRNLHRIVLINANTGDSICAFHMPVAPAFELFPRDMDYTFSDSGKEVLLWGSVRNASYREGLVGQVTVFTIPGSSSIAAPPQRIRYLLNPSGKSRVTESEQTTYCWDTGVVYTFSSPKSAPKVLAFEALNLGCPRAGSGATTNKHNARPPRWVGCVGLSQPASSSAKKAPPPPPPEEVCAVEFGRRWWYIHTISPTEHVSRIRLYRMSDYKQIAPASPLSRRSSYNNSRSHSPAGSGRYMSQRSSWGGLSAVSAVSNGTGTGVSSVGTGMEELSAKVDAAELAERLEEIKESRGEEERGKGLMRRRKGSVWGRLWGKG
ncbi:hypothetical protein RUND412_005693 [Rhizina undulata]